MHAGKDEELEAFIESRARIEVQKLMFNLSREEKRELFVTIARDAAAFSARRATEAMEKKVQEARDKAIEDCIKSLPKKMKVTGNDDTFPEQQVRSGNIGWNWCVNSAIENLSLLKSTT